MGDEEPEVLQGCCKWEMGSLKWVLQMGDEEPEVSQGWCEWEMRSLKCDRGAANGRWGA